MIAIDWGTTNFRAYLLDADGRLLEVRQSERGILKVGPGQFPAVLEQEIRGWDEAPIVMSGMVGSRQGWVEVPYVPCPAGFEEIRAALHEVSWGERTAWIVPGVTCRDISGVHDVMRGEEVQVLGAAEDGLICLPGTHSKWVEMKNGRIERFSTFMTGELYAVLKQHSILGRMLEEGRPDPGAFREGVSRSGEGGGVLHHLFGVRTRGLMGELTPSSAASYLSGILIGHELRATGATEFKVFGAGNLGVLYHWAARDLGMQVQKLDATSGIRALFRLGAGKRPSRA